MMWSHIFILAWNALPGATAWNQSVGGHMNQEAQLRANIFGNGYDPRVRPVLDSTQAVKVKVGVALSNILGVDLVSGIATLAVWLRATWFDPGLDWNSTEFGGVAMTTVGVREIWIPDFIVFNHVERFEKEIRHEETQVYLYADGHGVHWSRPAVIRVAMNVDGSSFPFDTQRVSMRMMSWSMNGNLQDLRILPYTRKDASAPDGKRQVTNGEIDLEPLEYSGSEFDVIPLSGEEGEFYYACCPEPWPEIKYSLLLRRKAFHYLQNIIIPTAVTTMASFASALLPHDCGERVSLCITCLLVLFAIMFVSSDHIPISDKPTVLGTYYTGCFFFNLMSLSCTFISGILYWQRLDEEDRGIPGTYFFRNILGIHHRSAVRLSFNIDRMFLAVVPVTFVCFSTVVLRPHETTETTGAIVALILASLAFVISAIIFQHMVRRVLGKTPQTPLEEENAPEAVLENGKVVDTTGMYQVGPVILRRMPSWQTEGR
mmetsp:Transcript_72839/g.161085  ORF Transcript_72839/g.161085 Transcript_72839/m.161085 type:complete len:487 (+) Transcript_72839:89-1549(+)